MIPPGRVATYGGIARYLAGVNARMVGYAMAATPDGSGIPWQRVINSKGEISPRHSSDGHDRQRAFLEREGIPFSKNGRINLKTHGWDGPPMEWRIENCIGPETLFDK